MSSIRAHNWGSVFRPRTMMGALAFFRRRVSRLALRHRWYAAIHQEQIRLLTVNVFECLVLARTRMCEIAMRFGVRTQIPRHTQIAL